MSYTNCLNEKNHNSKIIIIFVLILLNDKIIIIIIHVLFHIKDKVSNFNPRNQSNLRAKYLNCSC